MWAVSLDLASPHVTPGENQSGQPARIVRTRRCRDTAFRTHEPSGPTGRLHHELQLLILCGDLLHHCESWRHPHGREYEWWWRGLQHRDWGRGHGIKYGPGPHRCSHFHGCRLRDDACPELQFKPNHDKHHRHGSSCIWFVHASRARSSALRKAFHRHLRRRAARRPQLGRGAERRLGQFVVAVDERRNRRLRLPPHTHLQHLTGEVDSRLGPRT